VGWSPPGDRADASVPPGTPAAGLRNQPPPGLEVILTRTDGRSFRRVFLVNA
jgi:hypothetical protein